MTVGDWERVIRDAAAAGVESVQFIGGEPALHPHLPHLVRLALAEGLIARVFTNLVHVTPALWEVYELPGVSLGASWYSADPAVHRAVTGRPSHGRTLANLAEAIRRGIHVHVSVIGGIDPRQDTGAAAAMLRELGVRDIRVAPAAQLGRGTIPAAGELCGRCGDRQAAIGPDGQVQPCVMARWVSPGNVSTRPLRELLGEVGELAGPLRAALRTACPPGNGNDCGPASTPACSPAY